MTADEAIRDYSRLVWSEAGKAHRCGIGRRLGTIEDCAQVGFIALLRAADLFDPSKEIKFITYATMAIRRGIRNEAGRVGLMIHVPEYMQRKLHKEPDKSHRQNDARQALAVCLVERDKLALTPDREHWELDHEELASVQSAMRHHLAPQTRRWITDFVMRRRKLREIAAEAGYSHQAVQQRVNYGLRVLRRVLSGEPGPARSSPVIPGRRET